MSGGKMLKNYFTTAINNLLKNKLYSAINIIGLAVGLAACILITLYVQDELSYDKHWDKAGLIYRINSKVSFVASLDEPFSLTSLQLLPALKNYFQREIEFGTRIKERTGEIKIGDAFYPGTISLVDREFIKMFQYEVISGNLVNTLQSPGNIALSKETATLYFGDIDPIGKLLTLIRDEGQVEQYKVTAVFRFISPNTVLNIPGFSLLSESGPDSSDWLSFELQTYIRYNEKVDDEKFITRLPDFINQNIKSNSLVISPDKKMSDVISFSLQKISDIYFSELQEQFNDQSHKKGNKSVITIFIIISILILIIGCINFMILTTARATQRAKEVAMRKVVGARFKQLLFQFLGESILITLIAFIFALALTELVLPVFELMVDKKISIAYSSPANYLFSILLVIFVGLLGGLYPSIILSRFSLSRILKTSKTSEADGSIILRNILVVFQFTASIALIAATITAYYQLQYTYKHDPGFNPENLLIVEGIGRPDIAQYRNTLQQELLKQPGVINVCLSSLQPRLLGEVDQTLFTLQRKTDYLMPQHPKLFPNIKIDYNFFDTYEMTLLSGRYFTKGMDQEETDLTTSKQAKAVVKSLIINLEAAKQFGFHSADDAVGKILQTGESGSPNNREYIIIGVVADSQFRSLRTKPEPELYQLYPDATNFISIRYRGDYHYMVKEVRHVWNKVVGDFLFRDSNVKQNLSATFSHEKQENRVIFAFSILSVFIACMGLLGIASFTVERRVKEIGLRKVMGAKVKDIVKLLGWQFLKPVLIANIIAWPIAILTMQSWLERFPYRFNPLLMIPICLVAGIIALAIAWFTVAGNTKRAARRNPIHSLRYE
jgi:putative ABC transport system permease protein